MRSKIISSVEQIKQLSSMIQSETTVLCCGHFNIIHPGHMRFIQYARSLGSVLCVAIHSDDYLKQQKSHWQPFPQYERANGVAALSDVDYVIILDEIDLSELFALIKADIFVMGHEFEHNQNEQVKHWIHAAKALGTQVIFHSGSVHYASTDFLDEQFNAICTQNIEEYKHSCKRQGLDFSQLIAQCSRFSGTRLLVIGDTIVDQFIACDPIGMSSEAPVLALKELESKQFIGGAAIVACHIKALGAQSHFISVTGNDTAAEYVNRELDKYGVSHDLFQEHNRPTTFKIRYMVESQKMLRISRLEEKDIPTEIEDAIIKKLEVIMPEMHGVIVSDFVYGVITDRILDKLRQLAQQHQVYLYGDLQCSSQTGSILKFKDFMLLTPTERETRIALADKDNGLEKLAMDLLRKTSTRNLLITLGAAGFIAYHLSENDMIQSEHFPALATNPIDVAGAGDAVLSVMSLALSSGLRLMEAAAIAGCAASIAVNRVGNCPVSQDELTQFMHQLI